MKAFTGIFFKVNAFNSDSPHLGRFIGGCHIDFNLTVFTNRFIELGNLVAFNQVGIKVMLPVKLAEFIDRTAEREACLNTEFDVFIPDNGQGAGKSQTSRTDT